MSDGPQKQVRIRGGGFFLAEMLLGILILSLAIIPMYQMFVTSSRSVFHSKISYLAMHVAREELEELRQLPFARIAAGEVAHGWEPVKGRLLERTLKFRVKDRTQSKLDADAFDYPEEYERIETRLDIEEVEPADARMRKAVLQVRWQEKGESPKEAGEVGQRLALSRFETLLVKQDVD